MLGIQWKILSWQERPQSWVSKTTFCGIIGTSKNPSKKLELFDKNGAFVVLDSILDLPKLLNLE